MAASIDCYTEIFRSKCSINLSISGTLIMSQNQMNASDVRMRWKNDNDESLWKLTASPLKPNGKRGWIVNVIEISDLKPKILTLRFMNPKEANIFCRKYHQIFPTVTRIKKKTKRRKADCAAILIASSAASKGFGISPRDKCDKTAKGNLVGTVADIGNMQSLFVRSGGIDIVKTFCETPNHSKRAEVLHAIKRLFDDTDRKNYILYYSGHGRTLTGDWCFEKGSNNTNNNKKQQHEYITLKDILKLFKQRQCDKWQSNLIIIADCCFSGAWVQQLKRFNINNVYMQASCQANETCSDGKYGGVFTSRYLDKSIRLDTKEEYSKLWWIPGLISAFIGGVTMLIKDAIVVQLYDLAMKDFKPTYYAPGKFGGIYIGTDVDKEYNIGIALYSDWCYMNQHKTADSFLGWTTGSKYI